MLQTLKLLLPALLPSWNFFDIIAASPRVQYAMLTTEHAQPVDWQEFRPRPMNLTAWQMLGRMLWNPRWNESLFVMSCAERLLDEPTRHSENEILKRIAADLYRQNRAAASTGYLQFRFVTIEREGMELQYSLVYESRVVSLAELILWGSLA